MSNLRRLQMALCCVVLATGTAYATEPADPTSDDMIDKCKRGINSGGNQTPIRPGPGNNTTPGASTNPDIPAECQIPDVFEPYGGPDADPDGDGLINSRDNCLLISNANQLDSDNDGYGNRCDGDLDNNGVVDVADFTIIKALLLSSDSRADLDGDGIVTPNDLRAFVPLYLEAPGPSAKHLSAARNGGGTLRAKP